MVILSSADHAWLAPWAPVLDALRDRADCEVILVHRHGEPLRTGLTPRHVVTGPAEADLTTLRQLGLAAAGGHVISLLAPDTPRAPSAQSSAEWLTWLLGAVAGKPPKADGGLPGD